MPDAYLRARVVETPTRKTTTVRVVIDAPASYDDAQVVEIVRQRFSGGAQVSVVEAVPDARESQLSLLRQRVEELEGALSNVLACDQFDWVDSALGEALAVARRALSASESAT